MSARKCCKRPADVHWSFTSGIVSNEKRLKTESKRVITRGIPTKLMSTMTFLVMCNQGTKIDPENSGGRLTYTR